MSKEITLKEAIAALKTKGWIIVRDKHGDYTITFAKRGIVDHEWIEPARKIMKLYRDIFIGKRKDEWDRNLVKKKVVNKILKEENIVQKDIEDIFEEDSHICQQNGR